LPDGSARGGQNGCVTLFEDPTPSTVVFTDGACVGNPGPGGWAWAISEEIYESGHAERTTNQRMEVTAVLQALGAISGRVHVVSDSTYVVNCFKQRWWEGWRRRGWKNSRGEQVANQDLWRPLIDEIVDRRRGDIELTWVKGHSGHPMNELVDRLAVEAARLQRDARAG
jgi:ribonuclease HI